MTELPDVPRSNAYSPDWLRAVTNGGGANLLWLTPNGSPSRLFLDHFHRTSLIAQASPTLPGFLVGLVSRSLPHEAYIHFVGVRPDAYSWRPWPPAVRGVPRNCACPRPSYCPGHHITANTASIAYHRRLGFTVSRPVADYNSPGRDLTIFHRAV
jgi:hypothetical protein